MSAIIPTLRLHNRHTGEALELWREKSGEEWFLRLRGTLPPHRQGPPRHIHLIEDEEGVVTAGTLSAEVNGQQFTFGPGEIVRLPHGIPHRWWNDGDELLGFEGSARPVVDLDRYLQAVFEVINAGPPNRPPLLSRSCRPAPSTNADRARHAGRDSGRDVPDSGRYRIVARAISRHSVARLPGTVYGCAGICRNRAASTAFVSRMTSCSP